MGGGERKKRKESRSNSKTLREVVMYVRRDAWLGLPLGKAGGDKEDVAKGQNLFEN